MVREAGLEPARPEWTLEPESSESANSTTRAKVRSKEGPARIGKDPAAGRGRSLDCWNRIAQQKEKVNSFFHEIQKNKEKS